MIDTQIIYFRLPAGEIIPADAAGQLSYTKLAAFHSKEFLERYGTGWVPVSHQLTVISNSEFLLSVMLNREVTLDLDAEPLPPRRDPSPDPR